jgi:1,3-beta-glucanosyltransferase GAS1
MSTSSELMPSTPLSTIQGVSTHLPMQVPLAFSRLTPGIYIISDLSAPGESINRDDPQWTVELFQRYISVIDILAQYDNVLGFFAGNEVSNNNTNTGASAFVKAAVRDTKAYLANNGYRQIPVGYAANDDADIRDDIANYFACAPSDAAVDFYGINIYEWCGNSTFESSGYAARTQEFSAYPVPAIFSEYGCNTVRPREFTEVQAIYSDEMTGVWSGGIVYEYFQEVNDYGLVTQSGSTVSPLPDYTALSKQLNNINPTRTNSASYTPTNSPPSCPSTSTSVWMAATSLPPTPNEGLCDCAPSTFGCAANPNLSASNISSLFGYICGDLGVDCSGINANGNAPGQYGAYSPCNSTVKLSWLMNKYYNSQNKEAAACSFGGAATTRSATAASGTCSALISEAGAAGTGIVTSTAGAVSNPGSSGSSGSSSSGSSSSSSAASGVTGTWGDFRIVTAMVAAFFGGVALVVV